MHEDATLAISHPQTSPMEQRQIDWSQTAAPAEACLGDSYHAPK